jgi:hypothetical protein
VRTAAGALALSALSLPLLTALAFARDPQPLPAGPFTTVQLGVTFGLLFVTAMGWLLLLSHLLLRRSRVGWLLAVASGVVATVAPGGVGFLPLDALGVLLGLASFVPLLLPPSLRWFWARPSAARRVPVPSADMRRPD